MRASLEILHHVVVERVQVKALENLGFSPSGRLGRLPEAFFVRWGVLITLIIFRFLHYVSDPLERATGSDEEQRNQIRIRVES